MRSCLPEGQLRLPVSRAIRLPVAWAVAAEAPRTSRTGPGHVAPSATPVAFHLACSWVASGWRSWLPRRCAAVVVALWPRRGQATRSSSGCLLWWEALQSAGCWQRKMRLRCLTRGHHCSRLERPHVRRRDIWHGRHVSAGRTASKRKVSGCLRASWRRRCIAEAMPRPFHDGPCRRSHVLQTSESHPRCQILECRVHLSADPLHLVRFRDGFADAVIVFRDHVDETL